MGSVVLFAAAGDERAQSLRHLFQQTVMLLVR